MSYFKLPKITQGGQEKLWTMDDGTRQLLEQILEEIKKLSIHMSEITEEQLK